MAEQITLTKAQKAALDLSRSMAVTAGAGSGKTGVLVRRYIDLLAEDKNIGVRNVLAITFTDKAAAEMRRRVRDEFEMRIETGKNAPRWQKALEEFDRAAISTIHSFCGSLLREHPVEAGIDPLFETLDAAESGRLMHSAADEALQEAGEKQGRLRRHAEVLLRNWNRKRTARNIRILLTQAGMCEQWAQLYRNPDDEALRKKIYALAEEAFEQRARRLFSPEMIDKLAGFSCTGTDKISETRDETLHCLRAGLGQAGREVVSPILAALGEIDIRGGSPKNWDDLTRCKKLLKKIRETAAELAGLNPGEADWNSIPLLRALSALCLRAREIYEQYKGNGCTLDFDDLQSRALQLLRQNKGDIRSRLHRRFREVLVDEFQDTNHLQWEIVRLIVEGPQGAIPQGRPFIVGDPKQSIYGFRNAEIRVFEEVKDGFIDNAGRVEMDDNFRAAPAPVNFINSLMENLMGASGLEYDPSYRGLVCRRQTPVEGSVTLLLPAKTPVKGNEGEESDAGEQEAELVARQLQAFVLEGCSVWDKDEQGERAARWGDIAILLRARTRLGLFEEALRKTGIPFTVAGGFGFYQRQEVLDVINLLRFLLHQGDDVALAAVLRSPIAGISDDALYRASRAGGDTLWIKLCSAGEIVAELRRPRKQIGKWLRWSRRMPTAELLSRIFTDTGLWGAVAGGERGLQAIANIEKVLAIARAAPDLAACVERLDEMIESGHAEAEAQIEFDDTDSVRILTVHAAKGLEFPIVCVADTAGLGRSFSPDIYIHRDYGFGIKARDGQGNIRNTIARGLIKDRIASEQEAESVRQLYVALTRARDHLVISGTRSKRKWPGTKTWLDMICEQMDIDADGPCDIDTATVHADGSRISAPVPAPGTSLEELLGRCENAALHASTENRIEQEHPATVAPIACPAGLPRFSPTALMLYLECPYCYFLTHVIGVPSAGAVSDEIQPTARNAADRSRGLILGTIAHRLFEEISEIQPGGEEKALARYLNEQEISDPAERARAVKLVRKMAADFRASEFGASVLAAEEYYTELPFTVRIGAGAVSGVIDRLYRGADGWKVLDYKTDDVSGAALAERAERHKPQLLMYSLAAGRLLGCRPPDSYLYFARPAKAVRMAVAPSEAEVFERRIADAIEGIVNKRFGPVARCPESCEFCGSVFCERASAEE